MKLILKLLKAVSVLYWVIAASLFISLLFIPQALDTAYDAYLGVAGQLQSSEVVEEESSSEVSSSEIVTSESSSEEVSSEEPSSSEEVSSSEESSSEEVSSEEPSSSEEVPASEPLRMNSSGEESSEEIVEEETSSEDEVTCLALECEEETPVDPIPEEEVVSEETEFVVLSKAEFKDALEQNLLYSAIIMIPFTILVFSLSKKLEGEDLLPEEVKKETKEIAEKSKNKKAVKATKLVEIGLTGIKVPK